jgi:hypothetical protein
LLETDENVDVNGVILLSNCKRAPRSMPRGAQTSSANCMLIPACRLTISTRPTCESLKALRQRRGFHPPHRSGERGSALTVGGGFGAEVEPANAHFGPTRETSRYTAHPFVIKIWHGHH